SWQKIITEANDNSFTHAQNLGIPLRLGIIPDYVADHLQRWANMREFFVSLDNMEIHVSKLMTNLNGSAICIITNIALKWAVNLARKQTLQSVFLWPMSVTNFSILYHPNT
ncbi:hypothetical protein KI387_020882, partial [Taxus chinensis]